MQKTSFLISSITQFTKDFFSWRDNFSWTKSSTDFFPSSSSAFSDPTKRLISASSSAGVRWGRISSIRSIGRKPARSKRSLEAWNFTLSDAEFSARSRSIETLWVQHSWMMTLTLPRSLQKVLVSVLMPDSPNLVSRCIQPLLLPKFHSRAGNRLPQNAFAVLSSVRVSWFISVKFHNT